MTIKRGEEFGCIRKAEALAMQDAGAKFQIRSPGDKQWSHQNVTFCFTDTHSRYRRSPSCPATFDCDNETVREFPVDSIAPGEVFSWHRAEEALAMQNRGVKFECRALSDGEWVAYRPLKFDDDNLIYRRVPEESFEDRCKEIEKTFGEAKHQLRNDGVIMSARFHAGYVLLRETFPNGPATNAQFSGDDIGLFLKYHDLIESVL